MISPDTRNTLLASLNPPEGFRVTDLVACTYSLDLLALLAPPLSFSLMDHHANHVNLRSGAIDNAYLLLQSLREHARSMFIFHQAGKVKALTEATRLLAYLEDAVIAVRAPAPNASFHAKLWVTRFSAIEGDAEIRYRILVPSRNITFDASWDLVVCLDGTLLEHRQNSIRTSVPLADFVDQLSNLAISDISKPRKQRLSQIVDELRRTEFELPENCTSLEFAAHGLGARSPVLKEPADRMLIVSPFVNSGGIKLLFGDGSPETVLLTRDSTLQQLGSGPLRNGAIKVRVMKNEALVPDLDEVRPAAERETLQDLHAKAYVFDDGRKSKVWLGSANATVAGFERNIELMVGFGGPQGKLGVDTWLRGIGEITQEVTPPEPPVEEDDEQETFARALEEALGALASLGWTGQVGEVPSEPGSESFEVTLSGKTGRNMTLSAIREKLSKVSHAELRVRPITLGDPWWQGCPLTSFPLTVTCLPHTLSALTAFYVLELTAASPKQGRIPLATVINCQLSGIPEHRQSHILEGLLSDRESLMRFLRLLLSQNPNDLDGLLESFGVRKSVDRSDHGQVEQPLLEAMLIALQRDPGRCQSLIEVVQDLARTERGSDIVGTQLVNLCAQLQKALTSLTLQKDTAR